MSPATRKQHKATSHPSSLNPKRCEGDLLAKDFFIFPIFVTDVAIMRHPRLQWEGLTLPGVILFAEKIPSIVTIRHEMIHYRQYRELLFVPFILLYLGWLLVQLLYVRFWLKKRFAEALETAYFMNPFEREAHGNERKPGYLASRSFCAWCRYVLHADG